MTSSDKVGDGSPDLSAYRPPEVVAEMRLEEKAALLTGASAWTTAGVPRLGVKPLFLSDGPHGVRRVPDVDSLDMVTAIPATCFPTATSLASSWDPDLVRTIAGAIGSEARALGVDVILGPGVNMKRSPLCGRNFEYFSEDPFLAGELAVAYIEGVQERGVGACLKHFAVNNQETRRFTVDARLDERTLREIYLPAFEASVRRAKPWAVMCSYNSVNGQMASENAYLLTHVLRTEWGFDGVVVSDWGAVRDRVRAAAAGLDLEMPGPRAHRVAGVVDAVREGRLPVEVVDAATERLVRLGERVAGRGDTVSFDAAEHHTLARRAAAEGIVLLKNDGTLPLREGTRVAVIGRGGRVPHYQGTGSSHITPTRLDEPLAELTRQAGALVEYAEGHADGPEERPDLIDEATGIAAVADVAIVFATLPDWKEAEGADRTDIDLPAQQVALIKAVAAVQPRTVVVLNSGSAVATGAWVDDVAAVLDAWLMGQAGGSAVAEVLFGRVNPSGKLAETFPVRLEDTPSYLRFPGDGDAVHYGEGPFIGYRWYDARDMPVQFPFGHGLSYTSFEYSDLSVSQETGAVRHGLTLSLRVTNTGELAGKEVVQVYVRPRTPRVTRPDRELKGFAKVALEPGETRSVSITLNARAFEHFDPESGWVCDSGRYELLVGASSRDIRLATTIEVIGHGPSADLGLYSPLGDWLVHPEGRPLALRLLEELGAPLARALGSEPDDPDRLSALALVFLESMPMPTVAEFAAAPSTFGANGDEVVETLLALVARSPQGSDPSDQTHEERS